MKTVLITYLNKFNERIFNRLKKQANYQKHYLLFNKKALEKVEKAKRHSKFEFVGIGSKTELQEQIKNICKQEEHSFLLPYFTDDAKAKFAIQVYNKTYDTKIDHRVFKEKDAMHRCLGEIAQKQNIRCSYDEIKKMAYSEIEKKLGKAFILKPTNASSSLLNFKVSNEKEFLKAQGRIKRSYKYILEQYIEGKLYSLDFYCDGKDLFLLCFSREIPYAELLEKFSEKYINRYDTYLREDFLHFLPIRYTLPLKKISQIELNFIKKIGQKLAEMNYKGFIHLEYKFNKVDNSIGFIEWGARPGGYRPRFIEKMHRISCFNLPKKILVDKDFSNFDYKKGVYYLNNKDPDKNFVGIKTNVFKKTHITDILAKIPNFLKQSFEEFLRNYLWDNWKIKLSHIDFLMKTSSDKYLYPFYERSDTGFTYIFELEEEYFKKFVKKKHAILEKLVFHDYEMQTEF